MPIHQLFALVLYDQVYLSLMQYRDITSEELVNIHADQIDKFDSKTNAVCTFSLDFALDNARKIDKTKDYNKLLPIHFQT